MPGTYSVTKKYVSPSWSAYVAAHQVRMIELGLRTNLALESGDRFRRAASLRQHFDRFGAAEQLVLGLEDVAHAALADRVDDAIRAEREFGASFFQLFDLPAIEIASLHQSLPQRSSST